jgi:osmotically-inducible protein OsmY
MKLLLPLSMLVALGALLSTCQAQSSVGQPVSSTNRALGSLSSGSGGLFGSSPAPSGTSGIGTLSNPSGTSTQGTNGQAAGGAAGSATGTQWMIQRDQGPGSFVGADTTGQAGFVGAKDATATSGTSQPVVSGRITSLVASVNNVLTSRSRTDLYDPHLVIGFEAKPQSPQAISSALAQQLSSSPSLHWLSPISVSMEGRTATIRGEVASDWDRAMAEQVLLFEPGIAAVQNRLTVKSPAPGRSLDPAYGPSRSPSDRK